jgi:hypothetical protein
VTLDFVVSVELARLRGKFVCKDDLADAVQDELENANPTSVCAGDSEFEVTNWTVARGESVLGTLQDPRARRDSNAPPALRNSVRKAFRAAMCERQGCRRPFTPAGRGSRQKWCSARCRRLAWAARKFEARPPETS